ncbi:MAG: hypothetical protein HY248_01920 [Fimbriimonas ginsengisoli]|uniref:Double zinc ribbon domain-containing protein n=1 Tax=Fimbriimonas ginsengisoli TaxID=1005039 RepID=A0A931LX17_FIMGI|nr:hypothetical protein [Fimbriimonas ginsengisoli]MBI3721284.1 hypothetical protein [Fimbriimonas ginsengisoli]
MHRINPEGLPRHELIHALRSRRSVFKARRIRQCLLCRAGKVNEAGLCEVCYASLDDEELRLAGRWLSGVGP